MRLIAEKEQILKSLQNTVYPSVKVKVRINCIKHDIERMKKELPYEREVIENFGEDCQDSVKSNAYGELEITKEPKELYNQTFQTNE